MTMLTDAQWAELEPLVEQCRPRAKVPPSNLRRAISAILWRHTNGAKWRAVPAELGPWWMAAQTFIRWSRLGVWERLLTLVQERGAQLGMTFLDGTNIRAHHKAAGAARKGTLQHSTILVKRLAALVAGMEPKPAWSPTLPDGQSPSASHRVGSGARAAPGPAPAGSPAGCATLGRGRSRPRQPRLP
jgi:transposase